jgi:osmoprotectant transport system permease protein
MEFQARSNRFSREFGTHLFLSGTAVGIACLIGIPLGVWAYRSGQSEKGIFIFVNSVQTIPSLALFGIMVAPLSFLSQNVPFLRELGIRGIGNTPALIALSLYALLPITRNTFTSLKVIDKSMLDAGKGMGMNKVQLLNQVEIPLSVPVVLNGIRTALVQAIGNTTVAALIGAGGFGVFVFQGLGQSVPDLILLGTLPVIFLAVFADRIMSGLVILATPKGIRLRREDKK